MQFADVNFIAVIIAAALVMGLGFLWYGPLFGKAWMKMSGISKTEMDKAAKKGMMKSTGIGLVATIVKGYVLSAMMLSFGMNDLNGGLMLAFWIWLGFLATMMLGSVLWDMKPFRLYLLTTSYELAALLIMGATLGLIG